MKILNTIIFIIIFVSCGQEQKSTTKSEAKKIVVEEVLQTSSYTYLLNNQGGQYQWFATLKLASAEVGDTYYYEGELEMIDFDSKELNRTFVSVIFLEGVYTSEASLLSGTGKSGSPTITNSASSAVENIIDPTDGGITIAELMANKSNYAGKTVKVKGKVVKYNAGIMGKNWLHIQDGTSNGEENDITITTDLSAKVGDIITAEGVIAVDKDFGAGYLYKIIIEDAHLLIDM